MTFREPTRAVRLRFGSYTERYVAGLSLIVAGLVCLLGASGSVSAPMALGSLAHALGWWLLPARGRRRIWISLVSLTVSWVLLVGPAALGLLAASTAGWFYLRQRPPIAYLFTIPVFVVGLVLRQIDSQFEAMIPALAVMATVIVSSTWAARTVTAARSTRLEGTGGTSAAA